MKLYLDTSALVKFFHVEEGTRNVYDLVENSENEIFISELAKIEFYCALYRRFRNKEIEKENLERALEGFEAQINDFQVERLGRAVIREAEKLIKSSAPYHGLRTLDALQLATYSLISEKDWYFVSTDKPLNDIATEKGFNVINPLES